MNKATATGMTNSKKKHKSKTGRMQGSRDRTKLQEGKKERKHETGRRKVKMLARGGMHLLAVLCHLIGLGRN